MRGTVIFSNSIMKIPASIGAKGDPIASPSVIRKFQIKNEHPWYIVSAFPL